jgi:hypothetical protein
MKATIALKLDVSKIEKERLFKGKKGTYLDAIVHFDTQPDKYENNGFVVQQISKEERDSGVKGTILGNVKLLWHDNEETQSPEILEDESDDLPF